MRTLEELSEVEIILRALIYAIETKDIINPHHPFPMGDAFLKHKLAHAKDVAKRFQIPLVEVKPESED